VAEVFRLQFRRASPSGPIELAEIELCKAIKSNKFMSGCRQKRKFK